MLPHRPVLLDGESFGSILLRAASKNGWTSPTALLQVIARTSLSLDSIAAALARPQAVQLIVQRLGMDQRVAQTAYAVTGGNRRRTVSWCGLSQPAAAIRMASCLVCPQCIKTDAVTHSRQLWDHELCESCSLHQVRLLEDCPECGRHLDLGRPAVDRCYCGFNFADAPIVRCSASEHEILSRAISTGDSNTLELAYLLRLMMKEVRAAGALADPMNTDVDLVVELIRRPEGFADLLRRGSSSSKSASPRLLVRSLLRGAKHGEYARRLLASCDAKNVQAIGGRWDRVLDDLVCAQDARAILGAKQRCMDQFVKAGRLRPVDTDLERVVNFKLAHLNALMLQLMPASSSWRTTGRTIHGVNIAALLGAIERRDVVNCGFPAEHGVSKLRVALPLRGGEPPKRRSLHWVAERAGVHYEAMRTLAKVGFIRAGRHTSGSNLVTMSVSDARHFLRTYCFAGPLARSIGASALTMADKLMAAGCRPVAGPGIDGTIVYLFARADLSKLDLPEIVNRPRAASRFGRKGSPFSARVPTRNKMRLRDAARELKTSVGKIASLVRKGHLQECGHGPRFRSVTRSSVERLKQKLLDPSRLEINQAASLVGEAVGTFERRWILSGYISATDLGLKRVVRMEAVDRIKKLLATHILMTELKSALGKHGSTFADGEYARLLPTKRIGSGGWKVRLVERRFFNALRARARELGDCEVGRTALARWLEQRRGSKRTRRRVAQRRLADAEVWGLQ